MLRFVDQESEEELLLAGIKPLPINRMMRQAGREANDFYTRGESGGFRRFSKPGLKDMSKDELKQRLDSDPSFRDEYQRQVIDGQRPQRTDKYEFNGGGGWSGAYYYERPIDRTGEGRPRRENSTYQDRGTIPDDVKQRTMERLDRTQDAINNWDPIEASAQEDFNRLKGKSPLPDPAGFVMDIETIPTPSNPDGVRMFDPL